MMNKKIYCLIVCLILAAFLLASCAKDGGQTQQTVGDEPPAAQVTEKSSEETQPSAEASTEPPVRQTEEADDEENWMEIDWNNPSGEPIQPGNQETTPLPGEDPTVGEEWGEEDWD